jgi:hypothetical protein
MHVSNRKLYHNVRGGQLLMRRIVFVPIALSLVLGTLLSGAVAARSPLLAQQPQPMVDLWMSDAPDGPVRLNFLPATTTAYIVVRYTNTSETEYRIEVLDDSGGLVFQASRTYTGSDTDPIPLTGDDIFQAYQDRVEENETTMVEAVADAQTELAKANPSRTLALSYVTSAKLAAAAMEVAIARIRSYDIPSEADTHFQEALTHLDLVVEEADAALAALNQSPPDFAEARSRVDAMDDHATQAVDHATEGLEALDDGGGKPFLETRSCAPNTTKIVDVATGSAADSESWSVGTPGQPFYMFPGPKAIDLGKAGEITASPSTIYASTVDAAGAVHSATIRAMVTDLNCIPVVDDTEVQFYSSNEASGTVSPEAATTVNGVVTTTLTAGAQIDEGTVTVSATANSAFGWVPVTIIGPPDNVWVRTSYTNIAIGGQEVTIQAEVWDENRNPVADGTEVTFSLEPPGLGSWSEPITTTIKGWATADLTSGDTKGAATVRATTDGVSGTAEVRFVGPVHSLTVTADPVAVFIFGASPFTEIEVQAQDEDGYPAPEGTVVRFSLDRPDLGTFSRTEVPLDDEGLATTRLDASGEIGLATVTAQADSVSANTKVKFRGFEVYLPLLFKSYP